MKNKLLLWYIFIAVVSILLLVFLSCTKEKTIQPTCWRVYELSDKYTGDTVYIKTDTLWPWGRLNNVFCGKDTLVFKSTDLIGCSTGWQIIRHVIGNKLTYPKIYK